MEREMLGGKLAGVDFNPSKDPIVQEVKNLSANLLNFAVSEMRRHEVVGSDEDKLRHAMAIDAILHLQIAQMQLVKLLTWK